MFCSHADPYLNVRNLAHICGARLRAVCTPMYFVSPCCSVSFSQVDSYSGSPAQRHVRLYRKRRGCDDVFATLCQALRDP
jgi:hypothetical protein